MHIRDTKKPMSISNAKKALNRIERELNYILDRCPMLTKDQKSLEFQKAQVHSRLSVIKTIYSLGGH